MSTQDDNCELHQEDTTNAVHLSSHSTNKSNALYEPKSTPKVIRVFTVIAYILSVSLAAITLSAYYIFMWDGGPQTGAITTPKEKQVGKPEKWQADEIFSSNWTNNISSIDPQQWVKTPLMDTNVKLAGEEAKDRLYEPKHKKKLIRVLTVVAYVFFVSLAGVMLSLYYVFLWNGNQKEMRYKQIPTPKCEIAAASQQELPFIEAMQSELELNNIENNKVFTSSEVFSATTDDELSWPVETTSEYSAEFVESVKRSKFLQKLLFKENVDDFLQQQLL